ncbi:Cytidine deaminase [Hyella patelloides LEGE 07179]|uniref:Cytidine deaminase n=1 Tax=Hyella patelloides LEGE 07179 TaxID=945734 RepID=A0A563VJP4_9CYAN|nr:cytidine deaminase [Hyella patelloides]VEP11648.1 Cytidine deaminase [Hyella patelloides LEGE 07179]
MKNQTSIPQKQIDILVEAAQKALTKAYAPYSQFQVGAAVLTKQGQIFTGCNVENVSYGLSICAERNAIAAAVAIEGGDTIEVVAIAIANNRQILCSPCGACRQVIQELGQKATVIFQDRAGWQATSIENLLPQGFSF